MRCQAKLRAQCQIWRHEFWGVMESSTIPTNGINNNKLNRKWKADLAEQDMCQQSFCVYIWSHTQCVPPLQCKLGFSTVVWFSPAFSMFKMIFLRCGFRRQSEVVMTYELKQSGTVCHDVISNHLSWTVCDLLNIKTWKMEIWVSAFSDSGGR